jgi:hypothetical protein
MRVLNLGEREMIKHTSEIKLKKAKPVTKRHMISRATLVATQALLKNKIRRIDPNFSHLTLVNSKKAQNGNA